ncbi:Hypothetical protein NTJ_02872 [Nesidiocoris tenuis]|uniref:Uncharacterized protein n=1 Tax=Nesidiocoris tenuis TaxID=355587 RepID=A0ABN7ACR2_9HEMI|nr:Hypothetical protein NTJ_02872 [Nesidiocoris tenuis]
MATDPSLEISIIFQFTTFALYRRAVTDNRHDDVERETRGGVTIVIIPADQGQGTDGPFVSGVIGRAPVFEIERPWRAERHNTKGQKRIGRLIAGPIKRARGKRARGAERKRPFLAVASVSCSDAPPAGQRYRSRRRVRRRYHCSPFIDDFPYRPTTGGSSPVPCRASPLRLVFRTRASSLFAPSNPSVTRSSAVISTPIIINKRL